jgi:uncharacterized protein YeaO (DUF488 family)
MMTIRTKRVYDPGEQGDGIRILVDRVWPRGITKERLKADLWLKDVAPSTALRKWFNHDSDRWEAFKERYFSELDGISQRVEELSGFLEKGTVTLRFSARDTRHNQAVALKAYVMSRHKDKEKAADNL